MTNLSFEYSAFFLVHWALFCGHYVVYLFKIECNMCVRFYWCGRVLSILFLLLLIFMTYLEYFFFVVRSAVVSYCALWFPVFLSLNFCVIFFFLYEIVSGFVSRLTKVYIIRLCIEKLVLWTVLVIYVEIFVLLLLFSFFAFIYCPSFSGHCFSLCHCFTVRLLKSLPNDL